MNVYGKLTIIDPSRRNENKVLCKCECGNEKWINIYNIKKGDVLSCGCLKKERMKSEASRRFKGVSPSNFKNFEGKRIGLVTVLKRVNKEKKGTDYLLKCDCGTEFVSNFSNIRRSNYLRCTCGEHKKLKSILRKMNERCSNPKSKDFKWYGQKGVKVSEEWVKFPVHFINWAINNGWDESLSIDRVDSSKDYSSDNCRWITKNENCRRAAVERWQLKTTE